MADTVAVFILIGLGGAAIALIAFSAWIASRAAYWAILVLVALAIIILDLRVITGPLTVLTVLVDLVVYLIIFYYVSVQYLTQRTAGEIISREEFRKEMEAAGRFSAFARFIYYVPIPLLLLAIGVTAVGYFSSK